MEWHIPVLMCVANSLIGSWYERTWHGQAWEFKLLATYNSVYFFIYIHTFNCMNIFHHILSCRSITVMKSLHTYKCTYTSTTYTICSQMRPAFRFPKWCPQVTSITLLDMFPRAVRLKRAAVFNPKKLPSRLVEIYMKTIVLVDSVWILWNCTISFSFGASMTDLGWVQLSYRSGNATRTVPWHGLLPIQ